MDVLVIGGGIIGVRTALALADRGYEPTVLEKNVLGGGTTAASIAVFHWPQVEPRRFEHELRVDAWEEYDRLIDAGIAGFDRIGGMYVAESDRFASKLRVASDRLAAFGLEIEYLDAEAVTEYGIAPDRVTGALYTPVEGYLDPHELVQHWRGEAERRGATIETRTEVNGVRTAGGAVTAVETGSGVYDADIVVNATGPWAIELNELAGVEAPLRHTVGRIIALEHSVNSSLPNIVFEDGFYVRGEGTDQAFAGRLEIGYEDATRLGPDHSRSISTEFKRQLALKVEQSIPVLADATVSREWTGLRTVSPDGLPLVGATDLDGWYLACALAGKGIMYAPVVGDLVADAIDRDLSAATQQQSTDRLAVFDPSRFDESES